MRLIFWKTSVSDIGLDHTVQCLNVILFSLLRLELNSNLKAMEYILSTKNVVVVTAFYLKGIKQLTDWAD